MAFASLNGVYVKDYRQRSIERLIDRSITEIEIPKGVAKIGPYAFTYCTELKSLTIPNGVTEIGTSAFDGCAQVAGTVTVPEGVINIKDNGFKDCAKISGLELPDSLTTLGRQCFMNMHSLKKLVLPPRVTVLPITMASSCLSMTEFVALGDIKSINANSLQYCSSCLSYDFTACTSVPVLAQTNAFNGINAAAKIYVPATLYDEWIAATNWAVLADYIVGVKALEYTVNDDKTACAVTGIGSYTGIAELSIPSEYKGLPVTEIGASAFEGNEEITSLSIPESITAIGASAFSGCVNLSQVYFNAVNMPNLIYGDNLFRCAGQNADGIKVVIGNKVERIPSLLFNGGGVSPTYAPKVTSVEFEEGSVCTTIGWGAFYYNMQLGSFTAPPTLESIEQLALYHSTSDATFDFSACLQIPTLADSHIGTGGMSGNPTIYVPAALYDEWITATNWAELADWIVAK